MPSKRITAVLVLLAMLIVGVFIYSRSKDEPVQEPVTAIEKYEYKVIGSSVEGRKIESYTYGTGEKRVIFVGGIHGGYEWNSVMLAYRFIDLLNDDKTVVPEGVSVTVIPSLNPDGVYKVTGKEGRFAPTDVSTSTQVLASGRFNARNVDLNRNFDCKWQPKATWQSKTTSAGAAAFSEPEALALKNFVTESGPSAVVFWHSQANAVYASECNNGILPETLEVMNAYAIAAQYPSVKSFTAYPVTGDAEGWLASQNIPAITVELKTHESIDWDKNIAGIKALLSYFSKK